jgi:hypothetical protein
MGKVLAPVMTILLLGGCGQTDTPPVVRVYEVKGKVLLAGNKPLTRGRVVFVPTQEPLLVSSAEVREDGTFSLATGESGEGAPAGNYKVRVEPVGPVPNEQRPRSGSKSLPFPSKYFDEDSSGLSVTVKPEANVLSPFVLR